GPRELEVLRAAALVVPLVVRPPPVERRVGEDQVDAPARHLRDARQQLAAIADVDATIRLGDRAERLRRARFGGAGFAVQRALLLCRTLRHTVRCAHGAQYSAN